MALHVVSATMALPLLLLFSLVALSLCAAGALQADSAATNASSPYRVVVPVPAKVHAVEDDAAEGLLLRLPSSAAEPDPDRSDRSLVVPVAEPDPDRSTVEPVAEPDPDRSPVEFVAEPDPDRSHPDSDELVATKKPCGEGEQVYEKVKDQIDDDEAAEDKEKANKKKEGEKKTKKHRDGSDGKGRKEKAKKQHRQSDDEDEEGEDNKKRIHRHHRAEESSAKKKKNKLSRHMKNNDNDDDSDDEEEEKEKMAKWWRKAIKKRFGHGRRSQREEAEKEKVK